MTRNEHRASRSAPKDDHDGTRSRRPTTRSQAWRGLRDVSVQWQRDYEATAERLISARQWAPFCVWYLTQLPHVLLWLRTAAEPWLRDEWKRMCKQYRTHDPRRMARTIKQVMTNSGSSCLYQLMSPSCRKKYIGLVHSRPANKRQVEHLAELAASISSDAKYNGMRKQDPAHRWLFLPYACATGALDKRELEAIESREISKQEKPWNTTHNKYVVKPVCNKERKPAAKRKPKSGQIQLDSWYMQDGTFHFAPSVNTLLAAFSCFIVFSTRLVYSVTQTSMRMYRHTVLKITVLGKSTPSFQGTLRKAIPFLRRLDASWLLIIVIERKVATISRTPNYLRLQNCALTSTNMTIVCNHETVPNLVGLWWISRRITTEGVHRLNARAIKKELKERGFKWHPEQRLMLRIPPEARLGRLDLRNIVKTMFRHSYLLPELQTALMWDLSIVYERSKSLGDILDTTKRWINSGDRTCNCHLYPADWPRRHGHICLPSWQYTGLLESIATTGMSASVKAHFRKPILKATLLRFWYSYFPYGLLGTLPEMPDSAPRESYLDLVWVKCLAHYLRHLVTMGVDKCRSRKLFVCPALFWRMYDATFDCSTNIVHFAIINLTLMDYAKWLHSVYKTNRWDKLATWYEGSPPVPYILYKLKDLVVSCETVQKSKGKCCRQRPISPNTHHWLRRVYRRVGSTLRLVCLLMPESSVTFLSSQKLRHFIWKWCEDCDGNWLMFTGDISNCYDELDHGRCLDGLRWACSELPKWSGRRLVDRFNVSRTDRKDVKLGADNIGDRIVITLDQVYSVCDFDCRNSIMYVKGELYKRLLGAPMGGFLSAFYAIFCFAYIEHRLVLPMFVKLGLPGGIKRYLDDVLLIVLGDKEADLARITLFVQWLSSTSVFPPPLVLNVEPEGDQDFLEAKILRLGGRVECRLNNKVVADYLKGKEPYRLRLLPIRAASRETAVASVEDIATRCVQYASNATQLTISLLELRLEVLISRLPNSVFWTAWKRTLKRYKSDGMVQECRYAEGLIKNGD